MSVVSAWSWVFVVKVACTMGCSNWHLCHLQFALDALMLVYVESSLGRSASGRCNLHDWRGGIAIYLFGLYWLSWLVRALVSWSRGPKKPLIGRKRLLFLNFMGTWYFVHTCPSSHPSSYRTPLPPACVEGVPCHLVIWCSTQCLSGTYCMTHDKINTFIGVSSST